MSKEVNMSDIKLILKNDIKYDDNKILKAGTEVNIIDVMISEEREVSFYCETDFDFTGWISINDIEEKY